MIENNDERDPKETEYPSAPGADETPEAYPSTPRKSSKDKDNDDDGHRSPGEGPGAAKASEPHQRDHSGGRRNAPPVPTRPPVSAGAGQPPVASEAGQPPSSVWPDQSPATSGTEQPPSSVWPDQSLSNPRTDQEEHVTYLPPADWQGAPFPQQPPTRSRRKTSKAPLFLGIGIALALVVGVILIITALTGSRDTGPQPDAASNGIIAEDVSPFDFEEGQCFTEFTDATQPATVVTCETRHQAQLVNTFSYEDDAEFPGEEALAERAGELCRSTELSKEANQYEERLRQQTAYPQPESWQTGDRRVDCFIRITSGQITGSLID